MAKVRVYQLAKDLQVQSALILELLDRMGQEVKSDLSTLDERTAELVRIRINSALAAETERLAHEREIEAELAEVASEQPDELVDAPTPVGAVVEPDVPADEPLAAKPADEVVPAAAAPPASAERPRPAPVRKKAPALGKPPGERAESAAAAVAAATAIAGKTARKPRVFPARRVPAPSTLTRPKPAVPPSSARAGTPTPGRPAGPPSAGLPGRGAPPPKKRRKKDKKERRAVTPPAARPQKELPPVPAEITLTESVTVKELAEKLNRKSKDVIAKLISRGVLATINQPLEPDTAIDVAKEFGSEAKIISFEEEAQQVATSPTAEVAEETKTDHPENLSRLINLVPPI